MVRKYSCCFDDHLVPEPGHLEADISETMDNLSPARFFSDTYTEYFISSLHPLKTCVGPKDAFAFNVVKMAIHLGVFPKTAAVRFDLFGKLQCRTLSLANFASKRAESARVLPANVNSNAKKPMVRIASGCCAFTPSTT